MIISTVFFSISFKIIEPKFEYEILKIEYEHVQSTGYLFVKYSWLNIWY